MPKALPEATPAPVKKPRSGAVSRQVVVGVLGAVAAAVGLFYGVARWNFAMSHEETDDAQAEGHISPVLPRVSGYVLKVLVADNQRVAQGQELLEIDPRELDLKVAGAEAALQNALAAK